MPASPYDLTMNEQHLIAGYRKLSKDNQDMVMRLIVLTADGEPR